MGDLGPNWAHRGPILGVPGVTLAEFTKNLLGQIVCMGDCGPSWGHCWAILGLSWAKFGATVGYLGAILGPFGASWDYFTSALLPADRSQDLKKKNLFCGNETLF